MKALAIVAAGIAFAAFRPPSTPTLVHDFSHDFLIGKWYCRDRGSRPIPQVSKVRPVNGGAELEEAAFIGAGMARRYITHSIIAYDRSAKWFVWGYGLPPTHAYVSRRWFQHGKLSLHQLAGSDRLLLTQRGPDAYVVAFHTFALGAGRPLWIVSDCHRARRAIVAWQPTDGLRRTKIFPASGLVRSAVAAARQFLR